jgi:hypothetical protein
MSGDLGARAVEQDCGGARPRRLVGDEEGDPPRGRSRRAWCRAWARNRPFPRRPRRVGSMGFATRALLTAPASGIARVGDLARRRGGTSLAEPRAGAAGLRGTAAGRRPPGARTKSSEPAPLRRPLLDMGRYPTNIQHTRHEPERFALFVRPGRYHGRNSDRRASFAREDRVEPVLTAGSVVFDHGRTVSGGSEPAPARLDAVHGSRL